MQSSSFFLALILVFGSSSLLISLTLAAPPANPPAPAPVANDEGEAAGFELHKPADPKKDGDDDKDKDRQFTLEFQLPGEEEEADVERMADEATEEDRCCCYNLCQSACSGKDNNNYTCTCRDCFGCVVGSYSCGTFG